MGLREAVKLALVWLGPCQGGHQRGLWWALLLAALVGAPAQARREGPPRQQRIDMVVIHSTGGPTCDATTGRPIWVRGGDMDDNIRVIEAHPKLGIHHMIGRDGRWHASVPEGQVAHHVLTHSRRSIAIELVNDGDGVDAFAPAQLDALVTLLQGIVARHGVRRDGIRRHSDLDAGLMPCDPTRRRKVDPGAAFPFDRVLDRVFGRQ